MPEGALLTRGADLPGYDGDHAHDTEDDKQLLHHVGLAGIEPATSELSALRSNRLSYSPVASTDFRRSGATSKVTVRGSQPQNGYLLLLGQRQLDAADQVGADVVDEGA